MPLLLTVFEGFFIEAVDGTSRSPTPGRRSEGRFWRLTAKACSDSPDREQSTIDRNRSLATHIAAYQRKLSTKIGFYTKLKLHLEFRNARGAHSVQSATMPPMRP